VLSRPSGFERPIIRDATNAVGGSASARDQLPDPESPAHLCEHEGDPHGASRLGVGEESPPRRRTTAAIQCRAATRPRTRPRHRVVQGPLRAKRPFDSIRTDHRSCARPAQLNRGHGGGHRGRWTTCRHTWHGGLSPRAVRPAVPRGFEAPSGAREGPSQPSRDGRWLTLERSALVSVSRCVALGIPSGGHCVLISETVPS
jgi:hypothetical protein